MNVTVEISRRELLKAQLRVFPRLPVNYIWFVIPFLLIGAIEFSSVSERGWSEFLLSITLRALFAFLAVFLFCTVLGVLTASEKQGFLGRHIFEVTSDQFIESTEETSTATAWSGVKKIWPFRDACYVLVAGYRFHIIPIDAFDSPDDFKQFVKTLQTHAQTT